MSYLQEFPNAILARHYQMYHDDDALRELERRDDVLRKIDKQLLFPFAEEENSGDVLSVESYEAGYIAGWKASEKDLETLQKVAEQAGETLTYRYGRPVITKAMMQCMPCPFKHSKEDS